MLWLTHLTPLAGKGFLSFLGAAYLGVNGLRRRSLDVSGAWGATLVGLGSLASSFRAGVMLVAFYTAGSAATLIKSEVKASLGEEYRQKDGRTIWQVLCNAGVPTVLAVLLALSTGLLSGDVPFGWYGTSTAAAAAAGGGGAARTVTGLLGGYLGYYACCCGDTLASELGVLSSETPRLITTFRPVRKGTNGGVTFLGTGASALGGLFMGLVFYFTGLVAPLSLGAHTLGTWAPTAAAVAGPGLAELAKRQWWVIFLGLAMGLLGSCIDSVLGATLQFSGFDRKKNELVSRPGPDVVRIAGLPFLTNNMVNLVSATLTALVCAWICVGLVGV